MSDTIVQQITDLLLEAGKAHHDAFIEVDGADAEWAIWYAQYLHDKLPPLLNTELTQSLIVYEIIRLDQEFRSADRSGHWTAYYAQQLVEKYL